MASLSGGGGVLKVTVHSKIFRDYLLLSKAFTERNWYLVLLQNILYYRNSRKPKKFGFITEYLVSK